MLIRKALRKDAEAIATCLLLAMEDIVYQFIGKQDRAVAQEFMWYFVQRENNQYSYQNCWVAIADGKVLGAANVYNGAHLNSLRAPVLEYIRSGFNKDFNPDDETGPGEYYIDTIGVHPKEQGRGIGTKMLQFLIDEYVGKQSETLGLLVDDDNPNAKRLYLKLGFTPAGKRVLFGKDMEHLQMSHCHTD